MRLLFFLVLLLIAVVDAFRQQCAGVTGRLMCGNRPESGVLVKLVDDDTGPDPDDELASGYTDSDGRFTLKGDTRELTTIDPYLKIYHDCNDGVKPCQRKWAIKIPDKYVFSGKTPQKLFNIGNVNLEVELDGEERDCVH